ncbi:amidase signature domain-containing protein [Lasiosphaeris hirsuta]|uniref:Amidase signature domain-containing protein n=1 Tax=Lasiosphaeris hirsuta TaxID=260670 RepID=A0AA40B8S8_9PEZI|nr:amidase signature domain-containing protein [Lasiosphaeris hirsuta]
MARKYHICVKLAAQLLIPSATWALTDPFDVREATIDSVHNALFTRITTCRQVVSSFIARIETYNPVINAIISLNPTALSTADRLDARLASGNVTGALFCIPVLLKDNFDTADIPTTAGCLALADNRPLHDAPTVAALRDAGAIILGKANLHELALEGISVSSLGGQTVNPYDLTRTPGGSSGGSGAALAANFAVLSTGTDTVNSLRSPASANSLFSVRPTRGLLSRAGVIPVSYTQDSVGALARTVKDLAVALTVMARVGYDAADNTTAAVPTEVRGVDYSAALYGSSLRGLRLGLVGGFFNHTASAETSPVNEAMALGIRHLRSAGATLVNITDAIYNTTALAALDVQTFEYRSLLTAYLSSRPAPPNSFADIYTSGNFLVLPSGYPYITKSTVSSTAAPAYLPALHAIRSLTQSLQTTFATHALDALIYPEQKNLVVKLGSPSQSGRNGILAALTGSPVVTVPIGFTAASGEAPSGVPMGMEILGRPWSEGVLLNIARHVGELMLVRRMPPFANGTVESREYGTVPVIRPDVRNIPKQYPVGIL